MQSELSLRKTKFAQQLYLKYKDFVWILDDESYFTLTNSEINGNDNFYSSKVDLTPNNVKYKTKAKFEDKLFVYVIISPFYGRILHHLASRLMEITIYGKLFA